MNRLKPERQEAIIGALVEGASIRSVERMTGTHRDTIMRLGVRVGQGCALIMDSLMRDLDCRDIQVDEIWSYIMKKQHRLVPGDGPKGFGDVWTWVAIDRDTKLVPSWRVGKRTRAECHAFVQDLASRMRNRVQISADPLKHYTTAVRAAFGQDVDFGQIVKTYETERIGPGRYSPPKVKYMKRIPQIGAPDPSRISTSHVERQNLTMRMQIRRFTRLTNAFSKKVENHRAAVALHFAHYNLVRKHMTLKTAPAVAAGVTEEPWTTRGLMDAALGACGPN